MLKISSNHDGGFCFEDVLVASLVLGEVLRMICGEMIMFVSRTLLVLAVYWEADPVA